MNTAAMSTWIGAIRQACPQMSLLALEILLLVADGADSRRAISERLVGTANDSNLTRQINLLLGKAQWRQGRWMESPFRLLVSRPHPHIPNGLHLSLSQEGATLLQFLEGDDGENPVGDS